MAITNATRLSDFAAGIGTEGAILKIDNANQRIGIGTQLPDQMLTVAGIVTATAFHGDGSLLEGITSAGLGTAIGDSNAVEEVIYYTDDLLSVTETTTINPPASASAAYTQYRDVKLEDNVDLIVETGDDFIPDVLGLGTDASDPTLSGNGVFDEVYTNIIKNKDGLGAPAFPNGLTGTAATFTGNLTVGGVLTYEDVTNVDSVGLITARSGIDVTAGAIKASTDGINASSNLILKTGGTEQVRITSGGFLGLGSGAATNKPLHIYQTTTDSEIRLQTNSGTEQNSYVTLRHATGDLDLYTVAAGTNMKFHTVNGERLRIGAAGQIGLSGANYGTTGQVLTSQGASAAPQWATPAGGAWEILTSGSSTSAVQDWVVTSNGLTSTYEFYKLYYSGGNNGAQMLSGIDVTTDGGSTWASAGGAGTYGLAWRGQHSGSEQGGQVTNLVYGYLGNTGNLDYHSAEVTFSGVHRTHGYHNFNCTFCYWDQTDTTGGNAQSSLQYRANTAINGIRIHTSNATNWMSWSLLGMKIS